MVSKTKIKEIIFHILNTYDLEVTDINVGNGYFLFNFGENSVIHFRIKGCKHWKFGIWINYISKENNGKDACDGSKMKQGYLIEIFGQHEDYIDKFKPSYSPIKYSIDGLMKLGDPGHNDNDYGMWWPLCQFASDVKLIKNSPIFANIHFNGGEMGLFDAYNDKSIISTYIHQQIYYRIKKPIHEFLDFKGNKLYGKLVAKWIGFWNKKYLVANFVDNCSSGFICYPPYEIHIRYKTNDNDKMWDLYHKYYGTHSHIGFYQDIRVEHYETISDTRSFYYPDNNE